MHVNITVQGCRLKRNSGIWGIGDSVLKGLGRKESGSLELKCWRGLPKGAPLICGPPNPLPRLGNFVLGDKSFQAAAAGLVSEVVDFAQGVCC